MKEYKSHFLSKDNSICMKGLAAICVMFGHYFESFPWYVGGWFHGFLWVGVFFFYSGYGLKISAETKENYLEVFWKHKLKAVLLPYMIAAEAATVFCFFKYRLTWYEIVLGPILGFQYNKSLWYVIELFGLYIIFYLVQRFRPQSMERIMCVAYIIFVVCGVILDIGTWWYISTSTFLMGIMYERVRAIIYKWNWLKYIVWGCFLLMYIVIVLNRIRPIAFPWNTNYVLTLIYMIMIPLFVLTLNYLDFNFKGLAFHMLNGLGKISYDIYLWHMLVLWMCQSIFEKNSLSCIIAVVATIIWAIVLKWSKQRIKIFSSVA